MASHRKDSLTGPTTTATSTALAPRAKISAVLPPNMQMSSEYIEALSLLNEATMMKACDLLLSDRDYRDGSETAEISADTKSDLQQLMDLYQQCDKACTVIVKEGAAQVFPNSMPALLHAGHHGPVQRPGMVPSTRTPATTKPPAPKTIIPNRRMARLPPAKSKSGLVVGMGGGSLKRGTVERHKSVSDLTQPGAEWANKKARTGSMVPPSSSKVTDDSNNSSKNPPLAAKQFLAKLNKGKGFLAVTMASEQKSNEANAPEPQLQSTKNNPPTSSSSSSSQESSSPSPPKRTQPARASRNRS